MNTEHQCKSYADTTHAYGTSTVTIARDDTMIIQIFPSIMISGVCDQGTGIWKMENKTVNSIFMDKQNCCGMSLYS